MIFNNRKTINDSTANIKEVEPLLIKWLLDDLNKEVFNN